MMPTLTTTTTLTCSLVLVFVVQHTVRPTPLPCNKTLRLSLQTTANTNMHPYMRCRWKRMEAWQGVP
jgi:hypothetical protein